MPQARTNRVQAKLLTAVQIEQDSFSVLIMKEHFIRYTDPGFDTGHPGLKTVIVQPSIQTF
jgi:hypothetical protein